MDGRPSDDRETGVHHLRVLIANQRHDRLALLARVVVGLGHEIVASEISVDDVGPETARSRPDVALVGLGASSEHALELISRIVREAYCPVVAVLPAYDSQWVSEAAKRGLYAYILDGHPEELQGTIDITLRRFTENQMLHGAFERREVELRQQLEFARLRQRDTLELHDEVVQGLAVAQLALQLDRTDESEEALAATLARAKAIVARSFAELERSGLTREQLIRDAAGSSDG